MATVATQLNSGSGFASGEIVTATKLNSLVNTATVTGIVNADIDASAAIALSKLGTGALPTAITVASANIVDGTIVNADINASAGIESSKLSSAAQQSLVPAGAVMAFAMNSAPSGWLAADGSAVSRTTYSALFAAIGTTHGAGDGSTTFALPDLRGYFVRGSGTNSDGTASGAFGVKQADDLKSHTHSYNYPTSDQTRRDAASMGYSANSFTSGTSGATGGTETRPKNIALLYCVKF